MDRSTNRVGHGDRRPALRPQRTWLIPLIVLRKNSILIALDITSSSSDNRQGQPPIVWRDALAMRRFMHPLRPLTGLACTLLILLVDAVRFLLLCLRPSPTLAAENLFLRKQLALYQERHVTPRRATNTTRIALSWLTRWFDWRQALVIVQPATFDSQALTCSG